MRACDTRGAPKQQKTVRRESHARAPPWPCRYTALARSCGAAAAALRRDAAAAVRVAEPGGVARLRSRRARLRVQAAGAVCAARLAAQRDQPAQRLQRVRRRCARAGRCTHRADSDTRPAPSYGGRTCCSSANTDAIRTGLYHLTRTAGASDACVAAWLAAQCSACAPESGTAPDLPVCVATCDALHAACEDAFFAMDAVRARAARRGCTRSRTAWRQPLPAAVRAHARSRRAAAHASEHAARCAALAERAGAHAVSREGHCVHTAGRLGGRRRADVRARGLRAQGTRRVRCVRHACAAAAAVAACVFSLRRRAQATLRGASTAASLARCGPPRHAPPRRAGRAAPPPGRCARCCHRAACSSSWGWQRWAQRCYRCCSVRGARCCQRAAGGPQRASWR